MPESDKLTLKAQLTSEVANIRCLRPELGIVAVADGAAENWTLLEGLEPETEVIHFWHACEHLRVAAHWFEKYREILRHDPRGVAKVIRAPCHLRDRAAPADRPEVERELAFFRKHRHRMRYHALKEEGVAIGSGVVEAANKTLPHNGRSAPACAGGSSADRPFSRSAPCSNPAASRAPIRP